MNTLRNLDNIMEPFKFNPSEIAASLFSRDFNCAQSVLASFAPQLGMDESSMLKLASPFGGGVARRGHICGAVTGGLMVLGLARGTDNPAGKEDAYNLGQEFLHRFESRHGSILCGELLGVNIGTDEGRQQAHETGMFKTLCPKFVGDAVEIVEAMLGK
jgi:C_GCAxxG_C_C family probable redox protein